MTSKVAVRKAGEGENDSFSTGVKHAEGSCLARVWVWYMIEVESLKVGWNVSVHRGNWPHELRILAFGMGTTPGVVNLTTRYASDLTIGHLNTTRSPTGVYFKGQPGQMSKEIAVLPRNSKSGAFSGPGNSGSVVVDGWLAHWRRWSYRVRLYLPYLHQLPPQAHVGAWYQS